MGFARTGIAKDSAEVKVGYADFIRLCNVRDTNDWLPGLRVAFDGVWVQGQSEHLAHLEHSILTEHPDGDPSKPVVTFPCTIGEIESRIVDFYGNNGFIDPFELAEFVATRIKKGGSGAGKSIDLRSRERNNLLRIIASLLKAAGIPLEERGGVRKVEIAVEGYPFDGPKAETIRGILEQVRGVVEG